MPIYRVCVSRSICWEIESWYKMKGLSLAMIESNMPSVIEFLFQFQIQLFHEYKSPKEKKNNLLHMKRITAVELGRNTRTFICQVVYNFPNSTGENKSCIALPCFSLISKLCLSTIIKCGVQSKVKGKAQFTEILKFGV